MKYILPIFLVLLILSFKNLSNPVNINGNLKPKNAELKNDIIDVRRIVGDKYDGALQQLIEFYEGNGKLKKGELTLKSCK